MVWVIGWAHIVFLIWSWPSMTWLKTYAPPVVDIQKWYNINWHAPSWLTDSICQPSPPSFQTPPQAPSWGQWSLSCLTASFCLPTWLPHLSEALQGDLYYYQLQLGWSKLCYSWLSSKWVLILQTTSSSHYQWWQAILYQMYHNMWTWILQTWKPNRPCTRRLHKSPRNHQQILHNAHNDPLLLGPTGPVLLYWCWHNDELTHLIPPAVDIQQQQPHQCSQKASKLWAQLCMNDDIQPLVVLPCNCLKTPKTAIVIHFTEFLFQVQCGPKFLLTVAPVITL